MRRILLASVLLLFLALAGAFAALFVLRDRLILGQVRARSASLAPAKLELAGIHTEVLGAFAVTLTDLAVASGGTSAKLREVRVASPLSLLGLWRAYSGGREIPLQITVSGATVKLPTAAAAKEKENQQASPWPKKIELLPLPGVPVHAGLVVRNSEVLGPAALKDLQASLDIRSSGAAAEASGQVRLQASLPGAEALLPVALELKLAGTPKLVKLTSLSFKAAGLEAQASGELGFEPVTGRLKLEAAVPDLARLSLRPEDRAALGLTAQPAGALALSLAAAVSKEGALTASGKLGLAKATLPLRLPEKTVFSSAMEGTKLEGPAQISLALPAFEVVRPWGAPPSVRGALTLEADLTDTRVSKTGVLEKPSGVPLRAGLRAALLEKGVTVESASLDFHQLRASFSGELSQPLGKLVAGAFRAEAKSLAGFPALLPILREKAAAGGASLEEAQGSVLAEGRLRLLPATPAQSLVELKTLSLKNVRLPLAYKSEKISATGLLAASVSGSGRYDSGALDVSAASGNADLTGLALVLPGLVKKQGKRLLVSVDARGNPTRLQVRKATLQADGLNASLSGNISTGVKGRADVALAANLAAELGPLREYLPKLPVKVSNGTLSADAKIAGAWLFAGGVEKSPLAVTASARAKLGSVEMPEASPAGAAAPEKKEKAPLLPPWPVARRLRLGYHLELGSFKRGALEAAGLVADGQLTEGKFSGTASVAKTFGGSVRLTQLAGSLTEPELPVRGAASAEGMDLSRMAGFVDPAYAALVKGVLKAESTFAVPDLFAENLMNSATAKGKAEIRNGYVSTASLDQMVNAKLSGIPGVGEKAKVSTGGMAADMQTRFEAAGGIATLTDFLAVTPRKDEMRLNGTMNLAFDADMKGEAHITDAPVKGSFREANSDPQGRLVVPIHFRGNLKNPSVEIANEIIEKMAGNMARHEAEKLKNKAVDEGKKKLEEEAKKAGGNLLKNIFK